MDAIKKKMQAMKVEKDNAMDRADACEQAAKDAKIRYTRTPRSGTQGR
jgi:tropomyosin-1